MTSIILPFPCSTSSVVLYAACGFYHGVTCPLCVWSSEVRNVNARYRVNHIINGQRGSGYNLASSPHTTFHARFWKPLEAKVSFESAVIWDNLNPALMLIHPLQCHAVGACDTGLNQSRFPLIYKNCCTQSEPGSLTQVQPAVTFWAVRAGNVFT